MFKRIKMTYKKHHFVHFAIKVCSFKLCTSCVEKYLLWSSNYTEQRNWTILMYIQLWIVNQNSSISTHSLVHTHYKYSWFSVHLHTNNTHLPCYLLLEKTYHCFGRVWYHVLHIRQLHTSTWCYGDDIPWELSCHYLEHSPDHSSAGFPQTFEVGCLEVRTQQSLSQNGTA